LVTAELRERDEQDHVTIRSTTVEPSQPTEFGSLGNASLADEIHAFSNGRRPARNGGGNGGGKARLLNDPRRQPERPPQWEEQVDAAYALEAAQPTGTMGLTARPGRARGTTSTATHQQRRSLRLYPFGVSRERLQESARHLQVPVEISSDPASADAVIALKTYSERQSERMRALSAERKPIYMLRGNTIAHMQQALSRIFDLEDSRGDSGSGDPAHPTLRAIQEAEDAIHRMLNHGLGQAELAPQNAHVRRLQHTVAQRYNLESRSFGREPRRHVRIYAR
jgi:R3H domain-containing protein